MRMRILTAILLFIFSLYGIFIFKDKMPQKKERYIGEVKHFKCSNIRRADFTFEVDAKEQDARYIYTPCKAEKKSDLSENIMKKEGWHYWGKMSSPRIEPVIRKTHDGKIIFAYGNGRKYYVKKIYSSGKNWPQDSAGLPVFEVYNPETNKFKAFYYTKLVNLNINYEYEDIYTKIISKMTEKDEMYIKLLNMNRYKSFYTLVFNPETGLAQVFLFPERLQSDLYLPLNQKSWFEQYSSFNKNPYFNSSYLTRNPNEYRVYINNWMNNTRFYDIAADNLYYPKREYDALFEFIMPYDNMIVAFNGGWYAEYRINGSSLSRTSDIKYAPFADRSFYKPIDKDMLISKDSSGKYHLYKYFKDKQQLDEINVFDLKADYELYSVFNNGNYLFKNRNDKYIVYNSGTGKKIEIEENPRLPKNPAAVDISGNQIMFAGGIEQGSGTEVSDDVWIYTYKQN